MRGYFDSMAKEPAYQDSTKQWHVEVQRADMIWYEMVVNDHPLFDTRQAVAVFLKRLKTTVREQLEKKFIYFIASRKRLRFAAKQPRYSLLGKLQIWVEEGRERTVRKATIEMKDINSGKLIQPMVSTDDRFITFTDADGNKSTSAIHDFFQTAGVSFGHASQVHYVGKTSDPESRPIIKPHAGLSDILYRLADGDRDVFIVYNLFKVSTMAVNDKFGLNFCIPNSMSNEIDMETEGNILEKALIFYFRSQDQLRNFAKEYGELRNSLGKIAEKNRIGSITLDYEIDEPGDYYRFYSSEVDIKTKHAFKIEINNGEVRLQEGITPNILFPGEPFSPS